MGQGINSTDKATSGTSKTTLLRTIDTRAGLRDTCHAPRHVDFRTGRNCR